MAKMKMKEELIAKVKKLILHSERLAIGKSDNTQKFIDEIMTIELCNELKVMLDMPYTITTKQGKVFTQLELYAQKENTK